MQHTFTRVPFYLLAKHFYSCYNPNHLERVFDESNEAGYI